MGIIITEILDKSSELVKFVEVTITYYYGTRQQKGNYRERG